MSLSSFLRSVKRHFHPGRAAERKCPATHFRPIALEVLEARRLLSVMSETYGTVPLSFEPNLGQTDEQVQFVSRGDAYTLFLTPDEAVFAFEGAAQSEDPGSTTSGAAAADADSSEAAGFSVLRMQVIGANPLAEASGLEQLPGSSNYLVGHDPEDWRTNVSNYAKVRYEEVYPGVDLVYYGNQRQLEWDFVVAPGADPGVVCLAFEGADQLDVDGEGNLVLQIPGGEVIQRAPVIYQEVDGVRTMIAGEYALRDDGQVGFQVAAYDASRPLVIDPVLVYSTYFGGSTHDAGHGIAVDADGNVYVTGFTRSLDFPVNNAYQGTHGGGAAPYDWDAFVTKLNAAGTAFTYSTYLGGNSIDWAHAIAVDADGNAYVAGETRSHDFPTTPSAYQPAHAVGPYDVDDAFVTKLNPTGTALVYSTFLGGSRSDRGWGIALDAARNAYLTGETSSEDFPTTAGALQTAFGGFPGDSFVAKLNAGGTALVYSTFLGGNNTDRAYGITVDAGGNAYIAGATASVDFPTVSAFQTVLKGGDAFVAKLNSTGSALHYSTYLGGNEYEETANGIAVDSSGNAHVVGYTNSTDFPTTPNPIQGAFAGGYLDAFITKLSSSGSALVYSTYLGGGENDVGRGIALDADGNAYVAGATLSTDFPTVNSLQGKSGNSDPFVTKVNAAGSALLYSTYLGTNDPDSAYGIAVDPSGNAYVTGSRNVSSKGEDVFIAKLGVNHAPVALDDSYEMYGTSLTVPASGVLANDGDPDSDPLDAVLVDPPAHGSVTLNTDGSFAFTPGPDFTGIDSFTYQADDGTALSNVATVTITHMLYVRNLNDSGDGSLRSTIGNANTHPGADAIKFAVSGTINLLSQLPVLSDASGGATIDGTTAPGYSGAPVIALHGDGTTSFNGMRGLRITSADNEIRALEIGAFSHGIEISGPSASGNAIVGCYIGTDGTSAVPNSWYGVYVAQDTPAVRIGTNGDGVDDAIERNVISGNNNIGIYLAAGPSGHVVAGNYIGTDAAGSSAIANASYGVYVIDPVNVRIGTDGDGVSDEMERNVISGNASDGIYVSAGLAIVNTSIVIAGNYIGANATGTAALGNSGYGIRGSSRDQQATTVIGTDGDGVADEAERNLISGNMNWGVQFNGGGIAVAGNYIGTDVAGVAAVPNAGGGVGLSGGGSNRVGTDGDGVSDAAEGNVISGNNGYGITGTNVEYVIAGNLIGTDATGTQPLGNARSGIRIPGMSVGNALRIGTDGDGVSDDVERNVISNNNENGVEILNAGGASIVFAGNFVGTDVTGCVDFGNTYDGVQLSSGDARIGTNSDGVSDAFESNVFSGNGSRGLYVSASDTTIAGNYIGTDVTGSAPLGNDNLGLYIRKGVNHQIRGNVIGANAGAGLYLTNDFGAGDTGNVVAANFIGTDSTGSIALGNQGSGIDIEYSSGNLIGGSVEADANTIAFNANRGVRLNDSVAIHVPLS